MSKNREQYNLAIKYKSKGEQHKAIKIFKKIIDNLISQKETSLKDVHFVAMVQDALATTYMNIDELEEALYYLDKSILNTGTLLEYHKDEVSLHEEHALKLVDMALLCRSLEEYENAITHSQKAIEHYEMIVKLDNSRYQSNISAIYGDISMIRAEVADREEGSVDNMRSYLLEAIEHYGLAFENNPTEFEYLKERTIAEITLADSYSTDYNKSDEALQLLQGALVSFETLLENDSQDEQLIISSANSKAHIGRIYREVGEIYLALEYFEKAISDYQEYLKTDSLNYETLDSIAVNLNNIANIYISTHQKSEVPLLLSRAIEYYNRILQESKRGEDDAYDAIIVKDVIYHKAIVQIDLARFYIELGSLERAKDIVVEIISESNEAIEEDSSNINYLNQKAIALTVEADIYDIEHKTTQSIERYQDAIALFDKSLEINRSDLFTINHRAMAKGDIVTSCIYADRKKEGDFWFDEAMRDYEYGIELNPTFTDIVINRADLLSTWSYANKHSISQDRLLELLEHSMADYQKVLDSYPNHFVAMNNLLTISSDIAQIYKAKGEPERALELYYSEVESYDEFLAIYNNDLMSFMNSGVSKLLLAKELIEIKQRDEALKFLRLSLNDYDKSLQSDDSDIETLINKSLALREIVDIDTSSKPHRESIELNHKILELYNRYFVDVNSEKDTHSLTYNMITPLAFLLYSYSLSDKIEIDRVLEALEGTKSKTLKLIMHSAIEQNLDFMEDEKKKVVVRLQKKLVDVKDKIRAIKEEIREQEERHTELKGYKSVPKEAIDEVAFNIKRGISEKERLYGDFHKYSKEIAKLFHIKEFDRDKIYNRVIDKLDSDAVIIYPIYDYDRGELQVVTLSNRDRALSIDIQYKKLKDTPKFSNFILLIKEMEIFLRLKDKEEIAKSIKSFNGKYSKLNPKALELIFELDSHGEIIHPTVTLYEFMNNHRYKLIEFALSYLSEPISKSIPKGTKKIYFTSFGDLNMLPLHAIEITQEQYLIDKYQVVYIPSISIWADLEINHLQKKNIFISQDKPNENYCYDEALLCQNIIEAEEPYNNIDSQSFKELVHQKEFNILHLSVHGKADLTNPLNSHLRFKKSQLSLLEIHGLNLKANLIILSACESNLAKVEGADELLAFERAFMIAGATSIISTFDSVNFEGTKAFMSSLFTYLHKNKSNAEAFRQSVIESIDSGSMEWMLFRFMGE